MRFLSGFVLALSLAVSLRAEIPALLDDAWTNYVADIDRWAYTETTRALDANGQTTRETVTRYDPSQPYADQFTVLSHRGETPIEQMQKWARQRGINRGENLERPGGVEHDARPRLVLNGSPVLADLEHATVVQENEQSVTYEVPLRSENRKGASAEKYRTRVRVSKTAHAFEHVSIQLATALRPSVFVKLKAAEFSIDFSTVEPSFSPAATRFTDHAALSVFFKKREGGHESVRTDFKRVKPYRERFGVIIGPARTIEF